MGSYGQMFNDASYRADKATQFAFVVWTIGLFTPFFIQRSKFLYFVCELICLTFKVSSITWIFALA